ncbi:hypothetical protein ACWD6S_32585, partial [Streptomyces zhihengii]
SAIRREYAWRVSRGESTRNLDAFASLLRLRRLVGLRLRECGVELRRFRFELREFGVELRFELRRVELRILRQRPRRGP